MSPFFPYRCSCGYFEDVHARSMAAGEVLREHPPTCPRCGRPMERKPGRVAVQFKGQGWSKPSPSGEVKSSKEY